MGNCNNCEFFSGYCVLEIENEMRDMQEDLCDRYVCKKTEYGRGIKYETYRRGESSREISD